MPAAGRRSPATTRSRVDLPAPFGPMTATRSPASIWRVTSRRAAALPVQDRDAVEPDHSSYPVRVRRSRARKNGAPMTAVTTPTGISPSRRAARSAPTIRLAPRSAASGRTSRAFGPTMSRTTCGATSPTNPMSPETATAAAVASEASAEEDRPLAPDVDAQVRGGLLAEEHPVERPRPEEDPQRRQRDERRGDGKPAPRGRVEPAEEVGEDLAQPRAGQVHRHRQAGGQQGAHGVAREEQARHRRARAGLRQLVDDEHGAERPEEREPVEQPELEDEDAHGDEDREGRPERGPGRRAEHVRIRERVPEQALERRAGDRQPAADDHRREDPRQPQVDDDRLRRRRPRSGRYPGRAGAGRGSRACRPAGSRPSRRRSPRRARRRAGPSPTAATATGRRARPDRPAEPARAARIAVPGDTVSRGPRDGARGPAPGARPRAAVRGA